MTSIIRKTGKIGPNISGWVYVTLSSKRCLLEEKINFMANSNRTNTFWLARSFRFDITDGSGK